MQLLLAMVCSPRVHVAVTGSYLKMSELVLIFATESSETFCCSLYKKEPVVVFEI